MEQSERGLGTIEVSELMDRVQRGDAVVLDLRHAQHGKQIRGATRYNPHHLAKAPRLLLPLPKTAGTIVVYDGADPSDEVRELARKLLREGYENVRLLRGGFAAWEAAGGETEEPTMEQPVPLVTEQKIAR